MAGFLAGLENYLLSCFRCAGESWHPWARRFILRSLNVKYRDFRYIIPFILQFGLYASPIGFSSAAVPEEWRLLYSLNPVVGIVDGFRWCLLRGEAQLYVPGFLLSIGIIALLLIGGIKYFRQTERSFADIL